MHSFFTASPLRLWFSNSVLGEFVGRESAAFPIDLFRILVGFLAFFYFHGLWWEGSEASGLAGVIDHALMQEIFWFTRLGLFQAGLTDGLEPFLYFAAMVACGPLILGWKPKLFAGFLFLIAVSAFRWNFIVAYVEDAIMHLMLFWLLLLPIGRSLRLADLRHGPRAAWRSWLDARVPGTVAGCLLLNVAIIYLVAGLSKLGSPMWREGTALYSVLQLPVSRAPEFWQPELLALLKVADWIALVVEIAAPLALLLPRGHWGKWLMLIGSLGLHLGIVATMRLPLANIACLASWVLIFSPELMGALQRRRTPSRSAPAPFGWRGRVALTFVVVLGLAMLRLPSSESEALSLNDASEFAIDARRAGGVTPLHQPLYGALWLVGVAQQYQLFNWIDVRNHRFHYEISLTTPEGSVSYIDPAEIFAACNRAALLQSYLHDLDWAGVPDSRREEVKRSLARGFAERYCKDHDLQGTLTVMSSIERIDPNRPNWIVRDREVLFSFARKEDKVLMLEIAPHRTTDLHRNPSPF